MAIGMNGASRQDSDADFDLQALQHPAGAFSHPTDVVRDPDLTLNEKRAILAAWASDACAVDSAPALRIAPSGSNPVTFEEVMDALQDLDELAREYAKPQPHYQRVISDRFPGSVQWRAAGGRNHHSRRANG